MANLVEPSWKSMNNILKHLGNFFASPVVEGDKNKTIVARILHIILMILLGTIIIALLMAFSGKVLITNWTIFNFSAIVGPVSIITLLVLLQKGYVRFVAWALVALQWFATVLQVIGSKGLDSPALGNFIVTILLAGVLISRRGVVVFGSMSVVSIGGFGILKAMI